jgi:hypothetical protein
MPRRFALGLLALLVLLLLAFLLGRRILSPRATVGAPAPTPTARPTPFVPPTPIAEQRVSLFFPAGEGDLLLAEARRIPASADEIAFLRALASAVLDGPRSPDLLRPFPEGWTLRGAFRLRDGLVVLDLSPPGAGTGAPVQGPPAPETALGPRWQTGSHEELEAVQALLVTLAKNVPTVTKVALIVAGEPAETLAGHLDLMHPLVPDLSRASSNPPLEPPAAPMPVPPLETAPPAPTPAGPASVGTPVPLPKPRTPLPLKTRPEPRTDVA